MKKVISTVLSILLFVNLFTVSVYADEKCSKEEIRKKQLIISRKRLLPQEKSMNPITQLILILNSEISIQTEKSFQKH